VRKKTDPNRITIFFCLHLSEEGNPVDPETERKVGQGYELMKLGKRKIRVAHLFVDLKEKMILDRPMILLLSDRESFLKWFFPFSKGEMESPIQDHAREIFEDVHSILSRHLSRILPE